ncbi:MAG: MraY family glycosyltransferase [Balneolaceae bacterium]
MSISYLAWLGFCLFVTYGVATALIPALIKLAREFEFYDQPDGGRKVHTVSTPTFGGVAIYFAFIIAFSLLEAMSSSGMRTYFDGYGFFVAASMMLFLIGVRDDLSGVLPKQKLMAQVVASILFIAGMGIWIPTMGGLFGMESLPWWAGMPLSLFAIIVLSNAYNLIDGIDGLAGSVGVIASLCFGAWFLYASIWIWAAFSLLLAGSLIGFLRFNMHPARIFMGDTGSLLVGFFLSLQAIAFIHFGTTIGSGLYWQDAAPVIAMAILVIPLFDTLRVFIIRMARGQSPFSPDRSHLHHILLDMDCDHREATFVLTTVNILFVSIALFLAQYMGPTLLFFTMLGFCFLLFPTGGWKSRLVHPWVDKKDMLSFIRFLIHPGTKENEIRRAEGSANVKAMPASSGSRASDAK